MNCPQPHRRTLRRTAFILVCGSLSIMTPQGCSVKEDRSGCPCYVTLTDKSAYSPAHGDWTVWFFEQENLDRHFDFESIGDSTLVDLQVSRSCNCVHLWGNVTSLSRIDPVRQAILFSDAGTDSLYYASAPLESGLEECSAEFRFKRVYARLIINIVSHNEMQRAVSIRITGSTGGYYIDRALVDSPLVIERAATRTKAGESDCGVDTFSTNVGQQRNLDELMLNVSHADGTSSLYNLGELLLASGIESSEDEKFFSDITVTIDKMESKVSISIDNWNEHHFNLTF